MLTDREAAILDFEAHTWTHKEDEIRDRFGIRKARYYQLLNALLDNPEALLADPLLIGRLRRMRDARVRARAGLQFSLDEGAQVGNG